MCHTVACLPAEASIEAFLAARASAQCIQLLAGWLLIRLFSISMDAETVIDAPLLDIYVLFCYISYRWAPIVWAWFWRFRFDIFVNTYFYLSLAVRYYILLRRMDVMCLYRAHCEHRRRIFIQSVLGSLCRATQFHVRRHRKMGCNTHFISSMREPYERYACTVGCALSTHFHTGNSGIVGYTIPDGLNNGIDFMIICILISYISVIH